MPGIFLIVGTLLTIAYATIVPPFQVPDEDRHLWRAFSVSELHLVPPARTQVPVSFLRLHDRFPRRLESIPDKRVVHGEELRHWLQQSLQNTLTAGVRNPRANLYSFVPYIPASLMLTIGRLANWSPLLLMYAGRLANAAVYLWLVYCALRILPEFRLLLLTIALSPMSLHLAASFSADAVTLALTALLIAIVFKLAFDETAIVNSRYAVLLMGLVVLLTLCKFNMWMALLVALIPTRKFDSRRRAVLVGSMCVLGVLVAGFGWQTINASAIVAFRTMEAGKGILSINNAAFLLHHPMRFFEISLFTDSRLFWLWWQEFIGVFGWTFIQLSPLHVFMYTGAILFAALTRSGQITIAAWQKFVAGLFVFFTFISVHALLWVFETPIQVLQDALDQWVLVRGIQGRYFIPVALPALILLRRRFELSGLVVVGTIALVVGINFFGLATIWLTYS